MSMKVTRITITIPENTGDVGKFYARIGRLVELGLSMRGATVTTERVEVDANREAL